MDGECIHYLSDMQLMTLLKSMEPELEGTAKELKRSLINLNKDILRKEELILELSKKIREHREDKKVAKEEPCELKLNRRHTSEITPVGVAVEQMDAVLIFPEEVWRKILGFVWDPKDLWNLCNTCQLFEDILHQWKIGWMFEQSLPLLYQHLPGDKILECRRICKSWNGTVLNFLDNHPSLRPHTGHGDPRLLQFVNPVKEKELFGGNVINFTSTRMKVPLLDDDPDFHSVFLSQQNPFVGRYAVLRIGERNYKFNNSATEEQKIINEQLWMKVYKFLEYFGREIWYLAIHFQFQLTEQSREKVREFITQRIFQLVPKLRKLRVDRLYYREGPMALGPTSFAPAPELESMECARYTNEPLWSALLVRYHMQLRMVVVGPEIWKDVRHLDWANLTELRLNAVAQNDDLQSLYNVRMPNLSKLGLKFYPSRNFFTFDKLLELIHNVSSTSKLIALRLESLEGYEDRFFSAFLNLPLVVSNYAPITLKRLELDQYFSTFAITYDFLVRCFPLVENIHVFLKTLGNDPRGVIALIPRKKIFRFRGQGMIMKKQKGVLEVNKYLYGRDMYKSNIWEFLPQLKVFSIQWDVFTRDGYEQYSRKMEEKVVMEKGDEGEETEEEKSISDDDVDPNGSEEDDEGEVGDG